MSVRSVGRSLDLYSSKVERGHFDLAATMARIGRKIDIFLHLVPAIAALFLIVMAWNMAHDGSYLDNAGSKTRSVEVAP